MSKHTQSVLEILDKIKIKSTNEILADLKKKPGKTVNWHVLYRILTELVYENKAERLNTKIGFFWKR